jgi:hypothetical protein
MKGILDLINENEWIVRYETKCPKSGLITYKSLPLSSISKIMHKKVFEIDTEIEFVIVKENDYISHCKCTNEEFNNCEFFVRSGINECINFENIEIEVARFIQIFPKSNQTFDRKVVKELLVEVKNRFGVISLDNYVSDLEVIEWFERNYPNK